MVANDGRSAVCYLSMFSRLFIYKIHDNRADILSFSWFDSGKKCLDLVKLCFLFDILVYAIDDKWSITMVFTYQFFFAVFEKSMLIS